MGVEWIFGLTAVLAIGFSVYLLARNNQLQRELDASTQTIADLQSAMTGGAQTEDWRKLTL